MSQTKQTGAASITLLTTKQYVASLVQRIQALQGPYRKRRETQFRIAGLDGTTAIRTVAASVLEGGLSLQDLGSVRKDGNELILSVPAAATVEVLGFFGWKTVWNGGSVALAREQLELKLPTTGTLRIAFKGQQVALGSHETEITDPILAGQASQRRSFKETAVWILRGLESVAFHILLLALISALHSLDVPFGIDTITASKHDDSEQKTQIVDVGSRDASDFNGTGLSRGTVGPTATAAASTTTSAAADARAKAIGSGLSNIASRLSKITFGGGNIAVAVGGGGGEGAGVMSAMQSDLSKGQGTSLGNQMQKMAQGVIGKGMQWGAYSNGHNVSQQDLEEIANQFRALQAEFRGCYETALMKDADIAVTVKYESEITAAGMLGTPSYDFRGTITNEGEQFLSGCLTGLLGRVHVSKGLSGIKIKNQFIFKS